jgi:hypothetical protein
MPRVIAEMIAKIFVSRDEHVRAEARRYYFGRRDYELSICVTPQGRGYRRTVT